MSAELILLGSVQLQVAALSICSHLILPNPQRTPGLSSCQDVSNQPPRAALCPNINVMESEGNF